MGRLHTHGHRGPHSNPKPTRDTPKVAAFCFVSLFVLACDPPIKIFVCRPDFFLFPTSTQSRMDILHTHSHRGPHRSPKTTIDTPKNAVFCFVCVTMLARDPPSRISLCRAVFCAYPPYLSLARAYCTPTAIGAPMAAP